MLDPDLEDNFYGFFGTSRLSPENDNDPLTCRKGPLLISFNIEDAVWNDFIHAHKNHLADVMFKSFVMTGLLGDMEALPSEAYSVCVTCVNDAAIKDLNRTWRDQDKPTNILSFPTYDQQEIRDKLYLNDPEIHFGDAVMAWDYCQKEALDANIPFLEHISHMVIHGMLHILGYDHIHDLDAQHMEQLEINILKAFGYANPYEVNKA
ncbi:MAG: rRNA maturation RNase YbeY [Pseudomonadota bacterium]